MNLDKNKINRRFLAKNFQLAFSSMEGFSIFFKNMHHSNPNPNHNPYPNAYHNPNPNHNSDPKHDPNPKD